MKVKTITINNYKAVKDLKIDANGKHFYLIGSNGKGKTSAGKAIFDVLTKNHPSKPVTAGEMAGAIEVALTDGTLIYCRFIAGDKKPRLEITGPEGPLNNTREFLKSLTGTRFDVKRFLETTAPKQRRDDLAALVGIDFVDYDTREKEAFDKRAIHKRLLSDAMARLEHYNPDLAEATPVDVTKLSAELAAINDKRTIANNLRYQLEQTHETIKQLSAQLASEKEKLGKTVEELKNYDITDLDSTAEKIKAAINDASEHNAAIITAQQNATAYNYTVKLEKEVQELDDQIKKVREEKTTAIKSAKLPAEGMAFDEDGNLTLDGLPFEDNQLASSRKIIAGIQMAAAMSGELKFIHLDASQLDKKSMDKVLKWADKAGYQLAIERASWEDQPLTVEIIEA